MVRHLWTKSAKECLARGCNCKGCKIAEIMETECKMKEVVIDTVRVLGIPPGFRGKGVIDDTLEKEREEILI